MDEFKKNLLDCEYVIDCIEYVNTTGFFQELPLPFFHGNKLFIIEQVENEFMIFAKHKTNLYPSTIITFSDIKTHIFNKKLEKALE